jgi:hypothetical protein
MIRRRKRKHGWPAVASLDKREPGVGAGFRARRSDLREGDPGAECVSECKPSQIVEQFTKRKEKPYGKSKYNDLSHSDRQRFVLIPGA